MTEKFFNILPYNVIPVVFNGANMSAIAPPHSYINAEDFSSVEQLAHYLKLVDRNDSLFASYFWWRDYYKPLVREKEGSKEGKSMFLLFQGLSSWIKSWCDLCQYLHQDESSNQVKHFDLNSNHLDTAANCRQSPLLSSSSLAS